MTATGLSLSTQSGYRLGPNEATFLEQLHILLSLFVILARVIGRSSYLSRPNSPVPTCTVGTVKFFSLGSPRNIDNPSADDLPGEVCCARARPDPVI